MSSPTNLQRFIPVTNSQFGYATSRRRAFVFHDFDAWWWVVTDLKGRILAGERDWMMDAHEAADRAVAYLDSEPIRADESFSVESL